MGLFSKRVKRIGADRYRINLPSGEQALLASLVPERALLPSGDPSLARLFPNPYPDDPERNAGYRALAHDELLDRRLAALDTLEATIEGGDVDGETLSVWMRSLNDLRLILGTRLDVSEEMEPVSAQDPDATAHAVYEYLGMLLSFIIDALSDDLPDGDD